MAPVGRIYFISVCKFGEVRLLAIRVLCIVFVCYYIDIRLAVEQNFKQGFSGDLNEAKNVFVATNTCNISIVL